MDLKAETQCNQEVAQQLAGQKAKFKEANGKLRQLQKDHARLLERKLEADRRVTTLQHKVQQLRQKRDGGKLGSNSSSSGSKSIANGLRAGDASASGGSGSAGNGITGASSRSMGSTCEAQPSLLGGNFRGTSGPQAQQQAAAADMQQQAAMPPPEPMQWPTQQQQQQQQQPRAVAAVLEGDAGTGDVTAAFTAEQHALRAAEAKVGRWNAALILNLELTSSGPGMMLMPPVCRAVVDSALCTLKYGPWTVHKKSSALGMLTKVSSCVS
jgi:hypothetical protein